MSGIYVHTEESLQLLSGNLDDVMANLSSQRRTGKLKMNYLQQVSIIRSFLFAERTGNWDLQLYCIIYMIEIFMQLAI